LVLFPHQWRRYVPVVLPEITREEAAAAVWRRERFGDEQRGWELLCKEMVGSTGGWSDLSWPPI